MSGLGHVLCELGRLDEALTHCREAVRLEPNYAIGHIDLGQTLQELRRFDEAIAAYRKAVALDPRLLRPVMKRTVKGSAGKLWLRPSELRRLLTE